MLLCNRAHWSSTVWKQHLTRRLFSLGAAVEPQRTDKPLRLTRTITRLWPSTASQLQVYHHALQQTRSSDPWHRTGQTAPHATSFKLQNAHPDPGQHLQRRAALAEPFVHTGSFASQTVSWADYCHCTYKNHPDCAAMEGNNLKELPLNTGASTENSNFLI